MKAIRWANTEFVTSATKESEYPTLKGVDGERLVEVAVAGRSNVGKSTLLNHLFGRKGLVHVSSVPGKTQLINFFTVDDQFVCVDLPGYGYAKVPKAVKKNWEPLIREYTEKRKELRLWIVLVDLRRGFSEADRQLVDWIKEYQLPWLLVLTKADRVPKTKRLHQVKLALQPFGNVQPPYLLYSSKEEGQRDELRNRICDVLFQGDV